jgi:hypothetical protein
MLPRSKSPDMVHQEVYALLCVYQAIRHLIATGAEQVGLGRRQGSDAVPR